MRFKKRSGAETKQADVTPFRLKTVRFRKLLENFRLLVELIDDARDKMSGEYIFDRQYVVVLLDKVLEKLGMLVFDAAVMVPDEASALYAGYQRHKRRVVDDILRPSTPEKREHGAGAAIAFDEEPEFRLLSSVLEWMEGTPAAGEDSLLTFVKQIFDHVAPGIQDSFGGSGGLQTIDIELAGTTNRIELADLTGCPAAMGDGEGPDRAIQSRTLALMLVGAEEEGGEAPSVAGERKAESVRHWMAVADEENIDLWRIGSGDTLHVVASVGSQAAADFIFIYAHKPFGETDDLLHEFRVLETDRGLLAWMYAVASGDIERNIIRLGRAVFGAERSDENGSRHI